MHTARLAIARNATTGRKISKRIRGWEAGVGMAEYLGNRRRAEHSECDTEDDWSDKWPQHRALDA